MSPLGELIKVTFYSSKLLCETTFYAQFITGVDCLCFPKILHVAKHGVRSIIQHDGFSALVRRRMASNLDDVTLCRRRHFVKDSDRGYCGGYEHGSARRQHPPRQQRRRHKLRRRQQQRQQRLLLLLRRRLRRRLRRHDVRLGVYLGPPPVVGVAAAGLPR